MSEVELLLVNSSESCTIYEEDNTLHHLDPHHSGYFL